MKYLIRKKAAKEGIVLVNLSILAFLVYHYFLCRPIKGIQGLTREVIVALIANLESQKHMSNDSMRKSQH
jgi:hypothetical protein